MLTIREAGWKEFIKKQFVKRVNHSNLQHNAVLEDTEKLKSVTRLQTKENSLENSMNSTHQNIYLFKLAVETIERVWNMFSRETQLGKRPEEVWKVIHRTWNTSNKRLT